MTDFEDSYFMNIAPEPAAGIGMCRLVVQLDGETICRVDPHIGFSHRGIEKLMEKQNVMQGLVFVDKLNRQAPFSCVHTFVTAVEKLLGICPPGRASYIRAMLCEVSRICSHLWATAHLAEDTGTDFISSIVAKACDQIYAILDEVCQSCPLSVFIRPGGLKSDIAPQSKDMLFKWLVKDLPSVLNEIEDLLTENRLFKSRTVGIGVIEPQDALSAGFSGVNLRACGIKWDLRICEPYEVYDELSFDMPLKTQGDCYARYLSRIFEIYQSISIIRQILEKLPEGEYLLPEFKIKDQEDSLTEISRRFELYGSGIALPAGEVYAATESPLGEFGVFLISDGQCVPHRCHFRSAGFPVLQALDKLMVGYDLSDLRVILSSLNILTTETDR